MTRTTADTVTPVPTPPRPIRLSVRDLAIDYDGRCAVRGVDLDVAEGGITAIIGPSGCGKSSVLAALNRLTDLLPNCRVRGTIRFDGADVLDPKLDVVALRRRVGMIFQRPNPFPISIRRNLELPLKEHGLRDRGERAARIERALRDVGLWEEVKDRLSSPAVRLSGGQQQRLCLARALVLEPDVLLLDEPCSALDPIASGTVEDHVLALRERMTLVLVTHDLAQARRVADDVAFFWTADGVGRMVESGTAAQVFGAPRDDITRAYLAGVRG